MSGVAKAGRQLLDEIGGGGGGEDGAEGEPPKSSGQEEGKGKGEAAEGSGD